MPLVAGRVSRALLEAEGVSCILGADQTSVAYSRAVMRDTERQNFVGLGEREVNASGWTKTRTSSVSPFLFNKV